MTEEVRARAIEPFFTTKPIGQGTGLGLSQVYAVVRESGGTLAIDSEPGRGTTVRMMLPLGRRQSCGRTSNVAADDDAVGRALARADARARRRRRQAGAAVHDRIACAVCGTT